MPPLLREDRDLAKAMAASTGKDEASPAICAVDISGTTADPTVADADVRSPPIKDAPVLDSNFFWVESHWLRQWVIGEVLPPPKDAIRAGGTVSITSPAAAEPAQVAAEKGSSTADPVVLEVSVGDSHEETTKKTVDLGDTDLVGENGASRRSRKLEGRRGATAAAAMDVSGEGHTDGDDSCSTVGDEAEVSVVVKDGQEEGVAVIIDDDSGERKASVACVKRPKTSEAEGDQQLGCRKRRRDEGPAEVVENGVALGDVGASRAGVVCDLQEGTNSSIGNRRDLNEQAVGPPGVGAVERASPEGVFARPMRNLPLLCKHGGLYPASVSRLKLVTREVYLGLLREGGVPPPDHHLTAGNYHCELCVKDHIGEK